jgi:hypothetical protein
MSEMDILYEGLNILISTFYICADDFKFFHGDTEACPPPSPKGQLSKIKRRGEI